MKKNNKKEIGMSLAQAVLDIANRMENQLGGIANLYVELLRMAVKAAEGEPKLQYQKESIGGQSLSVCAYCGKSNGEHLPNCQQIQERLKSPIAKVVNYKEEGGGFSTAELVGGVSSGDMVEVDPHMPIGAKTFLLDGVYILEKDGKLHFSQEETDKIRGKK